MGRPRPYNSNQRTVRAMKILLATHAFSPAVGGIESCSLALARAFQQAGHEVKIVTQTLSINPADDHRLKVLRQPRRAEFFQAVRWCEVFFQNNISLQTLWPLIFVRRPWVVYTQTWLRNPDGVTGWRGHLKRLVLRWATNVYISRAIRDHVGHDGVVIQNPYDSEIFRLMPEIQRERSLVFLGRLVSDKGCDLLIRSLAMLRDAGLTLPLTIIGAGPEETLLKKQVADLELNGAVRFVGAMKGVALARELNRHEIMVVPSRWEEPFGIVALEGIACGCAVIGSAGGGLPDAIGPCGITFQNGKVEDLTRAIRQALELKVDSTTVESHLRQHRVESVAALYLNIFETACS